jgi:hypothetical protein
MKRFWLDARAQDVIEYSLLIAFLVLACAALLVSASSSLAADQAQASQVIDQAASTLTVPAAPPAPPPAPSTPPADPDGT